MRQARLAAMCIALGGMPAHAAETSAIQVTTTVVGRCAIQSTEEIRFGSLDPGQATNVTGQGAVTIACTRGVDFRLVADRGRQPDAAGMRRMGAPDGSLLPYSLRADSVSGTGMGFATPVRLVLEASVAGGDYRDLPASAYTDVIRVMLEH